MCCNYFLKITRKVRRTYKKTRNDPSCIIKLNRRTPQLLLCNFTISRAFVQYDLWNSDVSSGVYLYQTSCIIEHPMSGVTNCLLCTDVFVSCDIRSPFSSIRRPSFVLNTLIYNIFKLSTKKQKVPKKENVPSSK